MKNNENGRSMVEMLGVLAIIGVLSAGGLAGYSKAMYKYRVNETMNQLTMIVSNIRTLFGSQNTYAGLGTAADGANAAAMTSADALKYGIITSDMATGAATSATAKNPFKGDIKVYSALGRVAGDNETFVIEYDNLPAEACVTIVTSDWGAGAGSGLVGIAAHKTGGKGAATAGIVNQVGGALGTATGLDTRAIKDAVSDPFTIAAAVSACNPASGATDKDTSANASIALKYY